MKKLFAVILSAVLLISLCACDTERKEEFYEKKTVNVYYVDQSQNTTVDIRIYNDIPYISLEKFVALLYRGRSFAEGRDDITVKRLGSLYTVIPANGEEGVFDVELNTFKTANFPLFKNLNLLDAGIGGIVSYDGLPFVREESVTVDKEAEAFKLDFDDYGIDIYGDGSGVYLPIATLSDMYSCMNILVSAFNGKDIYIYFMTENESINDFGRAYYDDLRSAPRSKALAEFNYNEYCLDYDRFLGRPGRSGLESLYDLSKGLDAALSSDEFGRKIKNLLKSEDFAEYVLGLRVFDQIIADGGHSHSDPLVCCYIDQNGEIVPDWLYNIITSTQSAVAEILNEYSEVKEKLCGTYPFRTQVYAARNAVLGKSSEAIYGEETYTLVGDTAIIHIDGFMNEIWAFDAWCDYYNGVTDEIPFDKETGGAVGATYYGLIKANEDNVKRVIIDLSANTGGSTDEMLYVISLLTGHNELYSYDRITGQKMTTKSAVDRNLDRVFDEKDEEFDLVGDKELAVLVSQCAFSCGGTSPVLLHEYGIYTLGDNSGGGSCSIYYQQDAYGLKRIASSPMQLLSPSFVDIDTARLTVCDTFLEKTVDPETGLIDFTAFFDIDNLNALIDEHYKN